MTAFQYFIIGLLYGVCGHLYALTYVLIFKPEANDASLGIYILAWPVLIVVDIFLSIAQTFGKSARVLYARIKQPGN